MYWDTMETGCIGCLTLVGNDQGLVRIGFEQTRQPLVIEPHWQREPLRFNQVREQLAAYFRGERRSFDLPLVQQGTPFQREVWQALAAIPYGTVVSYGDIARVIGRPRAVRAVGGANGCNPLPIVVPCHRVIGSDGRLTGFGAGLTVKQRLLDLERQQLEAGVERALA